MSYFTDIRLTEIAAELHRKRMCEVRSLTEDNPDGFCAASHRGAIRAYSDALQLLCIGTILYEIYNVSSWNVDRTRYYIQRARAAGERPKILSSIELYTPHGKRQAVWSSDPIEAEFFDKEDHAKEAAALYRASVVIAPPMLVIIAALEKERRRKGGLP